MCFAAQPNVGMSVCMCVSSLNKSPVYSNLCVCVMKCSWECYKRSAPRCVSVCAYVRSRVGMGVCMCVCHHHSPVDSFLCVYASICMLTPLYDCDYIFLFHVYRSVSLARMRRYTQLTYLFHQCATCLLSRDSRIADCTVRHPGVERPFSSLFML